MGRLTGLRIITSCIVPGLSEDLIIFWAPFRAVRF